MLALLRDAADDDLDLSPVAHDRYQHADPSAFTAMTWALLGSDALPRRILLPEALSARRAIARSGLLFAAERRSIPFLMNEQPLSLASALRHPLQRADAAVLPGYDWKRGDELLTTDDGEVEDRLTRLRVIPDLEDSARRPPAPDEEQRRYRWIDNTGATAALSGVDPKTFNADADQVLYEAVDNVHEWAGASAAMACCTVTRGGGAKSYNRFHVAVVDNGVGIEQSIEDRRTIRDLPPWKRDSKILEVGETEGVSSLEALLRLLVCEAYGGRSVQPTDKGQGLHAVGVLAVQWLGTFKIFTADGLVCTWVGRSGPNADLASGQFEARGLRGTALHVTLDARRKQTIEAPEVTLGREMAITSA